MKVINSKKINAFGGLNFVHNHLKQIGIDSILDFHLPKLAAQSEYSWNDIFSTFLSIYYCGGTCLEDAKTILKDHLGENPFFKICSPDTIGQRQKSLASPIELCVTPRGEVEHQYNHNCLLTQLNIAILKSLGVFAEHELVLDYDNTVVFTEKKDSKMTYKRNPGYQPGVCMINQTHIAFVENRNGNSDAKSFQVDTLQRMFDSFTEHGVNSKFVFRADSASYQFEVLNTLKSNSCLFFISVRNSYVESKFSSINQWIKLKNEGEDIWIGETTYIPFKKRLRKGDERTEYRLLVKRRPSKTGQINAFTGDAYEYHAIITNDFEKGLEESIRFYNQRGGAEKQFDVMKNDFGWANLPYSCLAENCVFMYFAAICRNLYETIILTFAKRYKNINSKSRMKRFIFAFITKPARWVKRSRQWGLHLHGKLHLNI